MSLAREIFITQGNFKDNMGLCPKRLPAARPQAVSDALVVKDRSVLSQPSAGQRLCARNMKQHVEQKLFPLYFW